MSDVMIEARELSKQYGSVHALQNVSFSIRRGEVVGFLGPNGAGKTTTMKILTCYLAPSSGSATVNGADVFGDSLGVRKSIGYLPESTPLYTEMRVSEYLQFMANMRGIKGPEALKRIATVAEQTSLTDVLHKEIRHLSKGYRQRVGIAQALVHQPPILILDEPMSGLDPNQAHEIRDLIRDLGKERTVILSTHNLAEVQVTCQRVLIIAKGQIAADDTPDQLRARAGKPRFAVTLAKGDAAMEESRFRQRARELLSALEHVEAVEERSAKEGELTLVVVPKGFDDLRSAISKALAQEGFVIMGLSQEGEDLEQVFRQLTVGASAASTPAPRSGE